MSFFNMCVLKFTEYLALTYDLHIQKHMGDRSFSRNINCSQLPRFNHKVTSDEDILCRHVFAYVSNQFYALFPSHYSKSPGGLIKQSDRAE